MTVFFVSDRNDSHVGRFSQTLREHIQVFEHVQVERSSSGRPRARVRGSCHEGWAAIRAALESEMAVVLSGPLDSTTQHLSGISNPHIGISWATDVMVSAARGTKELSAWQATLRSLQAVLVDSVPAQNACIAGGMNPKDVIRFPWGPESPGRTVPREFEWDLPRGRKSVLFGRRLDPHYDPMGFVTAIQQLEGRGIAATWVFIAHGGLVDKVRQELESRGFGERVLWFPPCSPQDFRALVSEVDCVVSTAITDGSSITVLEALAAGTPVVATQSAGVSEWVIDGISGWTAPIGSAEALAGAIEKLLTCPEARRRQITENGVRLVRAVGGWSRGIQQLLNVIDAVKLVK